MDGSLHIRASLLVVAVFLTMGLGLEAMLGMRVESLLNDELRREMLRLGHAHGALLGLLNLGLSWAMDALSTPDAWARRIRIAALVGALCVGLGFTAGGIWHGPTDPGPLVLLVPTGALLLISAVLAVVRLRPRAES
ncbi:MAG: hypothetical protein AAF799_39225 [Myxococcota bacterium]